MHPTHLARWLDNYLTSMESTFSAELVEPGETAGNAENAPSVSVSAGRHTTENVAAIPRIRDDSIGAGAKLAGLVDDPGS